MGHMWFVWGMRLVVLMFCPAALLLTWLHPDLGRYVTGAGVPLVSGSSVVLMKKIGPLHQCPGRHTTRAALRAAIDDNTRRLNEYAKLFRVLGLDPPGTARREGLRLVRSDGGTGRGGDSSPGRQVSLRR